MTAFGTFLYVSLTRDILIPCTSIGQCVINWFKPMICLSISIDLCKKRARVFEPIRGLYRRRHLQHVHGIPAVESVNTTRMVTVVITTLTFRTWILS